MKNKLTVCGSCGGAVAKAASRCPHCGAGKTNAVRLMMLALFALVMAGLVWVCWIGPMIERIGDMDAIENRIRNGG